MTTAIVIPTLDPDSTMIRRCVESVHATAAGNELVIQHDRDRDGFAVTCNRGAASTDADVLVFLNDDTVCMDGWLEALEAALGASVGDVIAGSHLFYTDGGTQHSGVFLRRCGVLEAYNRTVPAPSGEVPAVTGACLAVGRSLWDRLGGFDEGFRNGYEDVDLCLRARSLGASVRFVAESRVVHLESRSPGRFDHVSHNVALLNERWGHLSV